GEPMVRKKTTSELEQAEIKLESLLQKRDMLNDEAQQMRQERDLVHEKKREVGERLRALQDRRASFAAEARAHREKRDALQGKAKALIELKRKLRTSGHTDVGAELRALTRRVSQMEMRQQTASLTVSKENELIDELKESMKRLKVLQGPKSDQDKVAKEVRDLDGGITDLFEAAEKEHAAAVALSGKARAVHEETVGLSREVAALVSDGNEKHEAYLAGREGTRLKPLTYKRPKPLMPVAGRPCIDYVLRSLAASGFHEIIVTTAYMSDALIKSIGDGLDYNASILYSFEENPAGTAGAV